MFCCAVKGCNCDQNLIRIPRLDPVLFEKWIKAIQRFDIPFGSDTHRICINHFSSNLYSRVSSGCYKLMPKAVPNMHLPPPVSEKTKQEMLKLRKANSRNLILKFTKQKTDFEKCISSKTVQNDHSYIATISKEDISRNNASVIKLDKTLKVGASTEKAQSNLIDLNTIKIEDDEEISSEDIKKECDSEMKIQDLNQIVENKDSKISEEKFLFSLLKEHKETQTFEFPHFSEPTELDSSSAKIVKTMEKEDLFTMCRFCFKNRGYFDIITDSGHNVNLAYIVFILFKDWLPVTGPRLICKECKELLCQSYILHKNYKQSSLVIEKVMNKENESNNDDLEKVNDINLANTQQTPDVELVNSEPIEIIDIDELEESSNADNDLIKNNNFINNQSAVRIKTKTPEEIDSELPTAKRKDLPTFTVKSANFKKFLIINADSKTANKNNSPILQILSNNAESKRKNELNVFPNKQNHEVQQKTECKHKNQIIVKESSKLNPEKLVFKLQEKDDKAPGKFKLIKIIDVNQLNNETNKAGQVKTIIKKDDGSQIVKKIQLNDVDNVNNGKLGDKQPIQVKRIFTTKFEEIPVKKIKK